MVVAELVIRKDREQIFEIMIELVASFVSWEEKNNRSGRSSFEHHRSEARAPAEAVIETSLSGYIDYFSAERKVRIGSAGVRGGRRKQSVSGSESRV